MEPLTPQPIEVTFSRLGQSDIPLLSADLTELSNLSPAALEVLEEAWEDIEPARRRQIMRRLVDLAEDNFDLNFDNIFKSHLKDGDEEVRSTAIEGLWENEEASLIQPLIGLLERDRSERVRAAAATALGRFALLAELRKLRPAYRSRVTRALLSVINDKSKPVEVRRRALESAAPLNLPEIRRAIFDAYHSRNHKLKISAIFAMGRSCSRTWLPTLLREMASTEVEMRYEAAQACGELGEKEAVEHLIELVTDADIEVQLVAIKSLGKIGDPEAKECLEGCLDNPDEAIQQAAEQALEELEAGEDLMSFQF